MLERGTALLLIAGRFDGDAFVDWICHRAGVLDLSGWVRMSAPGRIEVMASGAPVLVEALEIACSLGPSGAIVDRIDVTAANDPVAGRGFTRL